MESMSLASACNSQPMSNSNSMDSTHSNSRNSASTTLTSTVSDSKDSKLEWSFLSNCAPHIHHPWDPPGSLPRLTITVRQFSDRVPTDDDSELLGKLLLGRKSLPPMFTFQNLKTVIMHKSRNRDAVPITQIQVPFTGKNGKSYQARLGAEVWHVLLKASEEYEECTWFKVFFWDNATLMDQKCELCRSKVSQRVGSDMILEHPESTVRDGVAPPIVEGCVRYIYPMMARGRGEGSRMLP